MKRSDFLVKSGLVGMGIVLYSNVISQLITNEITMTKVLSSGTIDQVRHGNFNPQLLRIKGFPSWFSVFEKQRLFINGIEPSASDLLTQSFEAGNTTYTLNQVRDQCFINLPNHIIEITPGQALYINRNKQLTNVVESKQITLGKEQIIVLIDGWANVNGVKLQAKEICYLPYSINESQFAPTSRVLIFG
jgi:hypothetical protein